jgi:hypothetical protein
MGRLISNEWESFMFTSLHLISNLIVYSIWERCPFTMEYSTLCRNLFISSFKNCLNVSSTVDSLVLSLSERNIVAGHIEEFLTNLQRQALLFSLKSSFFISNNPFTFTVKLSSHLTWSFHKMIFLLRKSDCSWTKRTLKINNEAPSEAPSFLIFLKGYFL